jgi:5-methylcytosine-specific restriction endonuclease McrA
MSAIASPVLVLNKHWVPIRITTAADALTKMFAGHAKAVRAEDYSMHGFQSWADLGAMHDSIYVITARSYISVPDAIVLLKYGEVPEKVLVFSRNNIFRRDHYTCQYCGAKPGAPELTIDHVTPKSRGGKSSWTNCVLSCIACNRKKANKTPAEAGMVLRKQPVKPNWSPMLILQKVKNTPKNWQKFVSDMYWHTALEE